MWHEWLAHQWDERERKWKLYIRVDCRTETLYCQIIHAKCLRVCVAFFLCLFLFIHICIHFGFEKCRLAQWWWWWWCSCDIIESPLLSHDNTYTSMMWQPHIIHRHWMKKKINKWSLCVPVNIPYEHMKWSIVCLHFISWYGVSVRVCVCGSITLLRIYLCTYTVSS